MHSFDIHYHHLVDFIVLPTSPGATLPHSVACAIYCAYRQYPDSKQIILGLHISFLLVCTHSSTYLQTTWTISNIILALLFGTLHQAGVVPSLCHLHEVITADLAKNETVQVVYWKTYM